MSKLKVTTIADVADSESTDVTNVINGSAKAWVNFDGTFGSSPYTVANGGIRAAFNVSSVVDNGTGDYTVNFTTAMTDANYAMAGAAEAVNGSGNQANTVGTLRVSSGTSYSTGSIRVITNEGATSRADSNVVSIAIFR